MINRSPGACNGLYVSYTDDGSWIRAWYSKESDAMNFQLVPVGAMPSQDWGYCTSAPAVPEQINVQIAGPNSVVLSFVTFEAEKRTQAPSAFVGKTDNSLTDKIEGVTHVHVTAAGDRTYFMYFVKLSGLTPRMR